MAGYNYDGMGLFGASLAMGMLLSPVIMTPVVVQLFNRRSRPLAVAAEVLIIAPFLAIIPPIGLGIAQIMSEETATGIAALCWVSAIVCLIVGAGRWAFGGRAERKNG